MFELNETLELNEMTVTWVDRTYRTERGLRRFLATLTPAQLEEAEVLVDDDTFVVFYPVTVPARKAHRSVFHFDLNADSDGSLPVCGTGPEPKIAVELQEEQQDEEEEARKKAERVRVFNILLAGVQL